MQSMRCGKASTHFYEKAKELGYIVLTNKNYQFTRFVRALQRGITISTFHWDAYMFAISIQPI